MNKKTLRIITILSTIVVCLGMSTLTLAADSGTDLSIIDTKPIDNSQISTIGSTIAGYISTVAMVISVIVLMILGIKYMMGSAEQKAEYKKSFIPYIVGAILVFGASGIANLVFNAATTITD